MAIPTPVCRLANTCGIREKRQNRAITASSVLFVGKGFVKISIKAAGVWYQVETYVNIGSQSRCDLCCGLGHIANKCGSQPTCGYMSSHHQTIDHKCNVVACAMKQGLLYRHILEMCPNCRGNDITFSNRCVKRTDSAKATW